MFISTMMGKQRPILYAARMVMHFFQKFSFFWPSCEHVSAFQPCRPESWNGRSQASGPCPCPLALWRRCTGTAKAIGGPFLPDESVMLWIVPSEDSCCVDQSLCSLWVFQLTGKSFKSLFLQTNWHHPEQCSSITGPIQAAEVQPNNKAAFSFLFCSSNFESFYQLLLRVHHSFQFAFIS